MSKKNNKKKKRPRRVYYCTKCGKWRGKETQCPECGQRTYKRLLPLARGNYYYIPGIDQPLIRTTKVIKEVLAKPALRFWAAQRSAEAALADPTLSVNQAATAMFRSRDKAGNRGTDVHNILEKLSLQSRPKWSYYNKEYPEINAYKNWRKSFPHEVEDTEFIVYSKKNRYAGRPDAQLKDSSGNRWLIDYKTGGIYISAVLQLSSYALALTGMKKRKNVDKLGVLSLNEDGSYTFKEVKYSPKAWKHTLNLFRWKINYNL